MRGAWFPGSLAAALPLLAVLLQPPLRAQEGRQQIARLGACRLESGQLIEDCRIGYRTYGTLNAAGDNAVLMPTWLYGTSGELANLFADHPSATRLVDTSRFFGVALDAFGNGVSSSPSNSTTQHGPSFPIFTTADMVEAEYRVATEILHLKHVHAIVGLSMGGEQTFQWAVLHPDFFDLAVPIVSTPRLTVYDLQSKRIMLEAIRSDPGFLGGNYTREPALRLANLINVQAVTTPELRNQSTPREGFEAFVAKSEAPLSIDANDRVSQLEAIVRHDALHGRSIEDVARSVRPRFLVIVAAQDHMVTPSEAIRWAHAVNAPLYVSQGTCAHLIMTCDAPAVEQRTDHFLKGEPLP
ncbi:homoserine O-acetyltransferase [Bryocella elongata]|uniref:Homoserine O-acetyltransferase n=1 Tax=Bryocella elongata TaxID=863522 RepID=A0A1H5XX67_9BACT|nr:alpha/beta fold hydrolase [Bryocella elongata]SEG16291.1 homoserine O-acetyltransferase [Bryocella elongata]